LKITGIHDLIVDARQIDEMQGISPKSIIDNYFSEGLQIIIAVL